MTSQRCDKRCISADSGDCTCECGGANHAGGRLPPYGLPGRPTTLERHVHTGGIRVRPDPLAEMKAPWAAEMEDDE